MTILLVTFLGIFGVILSAGLLVFYRDVIRERLTAIVDHQIASGNSIFTIFQPRQGTMEQIVRPFQNVLPRSTQEVSVAQKRLIRAGFRQDSDVNMLYGAKVLVPLSLMLLATASGAYSWSPFFVYAVAAGVGFLIPDFWLGKRISSRQMKLRLGLPEALDLLVICSEAGLSLDQALLKVSQELRLSQPELADEFGLLM